jgi:hypothetical protein
MWFWSRQPGEILSTDYDSKIESCKKYTISLTMPTFCSGAFNGSVAQRLEQARTPKAFVSRRIRGWSSAIRVIKFEKITGL